MSYRLRLYVPADERITFVYLVNTAGQPFATAIPQGISQPCYDGYIDAPVWIEPHFADGYDGSIVSKYYINIDGAVNEAAPGQPYGNLLIPYAGAYVTASNVQVRLELITTETYYAVLGFDANDGTGAPEAISGSWVNTQPYVRFTIPTETPTRPGYAFAGWNQQADGSGAKTFFPGDYFDGWGQTSPPGPTYTLYAMWTKAASGITAMIYDNGWGEYTPMIYDNGWHEYEPVLPGG